MSRSEKGLINIAICVGSPMLDFFAPIIRHLCVGLVDFPLRLQLVSSDQRIHSASLGPTLPVLHKASGVWWSGAALRRLSLSFVDSPPDIVHTFGADSLRVASWLAKEFDAEQINYVLTSADVDRFLRARNEGQVRYAAASQRLAEKLSQSKLHRGDSIAVIAPGVHASKAPSCFHHDDRIATIVFPSPLDRRSGWPALLDGLAFAQQGGAEFMCFFTGRGGDERHVRRAVEGQRLGRCVVFAHPSGDLEPALQSADLYILPAPDDRMIVDSLTAMAAGVLVIAVGWDSADHLIPKETAWIAPGADGRSLGEAILGAIADRACSRAIASRGQQHVRDGCIPFPVALLKNYSYPSCV